MNAGAIASQAALGRRSIPSAIISPLIQRYVDEYQNRTGTEAGERDQPRSAVQGTGTPGSSVENLNRDLFFFMDAVAVLAEEAGIQADSLYRHLTGRRQWMSFDIADRLICAMGMTHLWHLEPLASYYETVNIL